eukprot:TRINITY_DN5277_c0_g1_i1.p1 TRINITY_DN5277_c0_g1~~TRINITY_DN5277_c0_g1_i1.p1  ORF type:complete len:150 (-),score=18.39 TRINITY_DN5277_c0_g1_i1:330-779(-)
MCMEVTPAALQPPFPLPARKEHSAHVKNTFTFFHFLSQGFDDSGWGCAYRSCQTICSWLINKEIGKEHRKISLPPSHLEIQKLLVEVGDKPPSFLNSKQWIGSFEIFLILESLFGVLENQTTSPQEADDICMMLDSFQNIEYQQRRPSA